MEGIFVTGTDTGVGKTVVCAGLLKLLQGSRDICYWKPVQTGTIVGDDTQEVMRLSGLSADHFVEPSYRFPEPVSPQLAARRWGKTVELSDLTSRFERERNGKRFWIVEGAGGVFMPLNDTLLQIDFMKRLALPILIVAEDRVGAVNHTLLTLKACQAAQAPVLGVILTRSRKTLGNAESITHFGKVSILAELDPSEDPRVIVATVGADASLRNVLQVPSLPA